jgi:type III restriction enzyme
MELILEQSLQHQQTAVDAVCDALSSAAFDAPGKYYENPILHNDAEIALDIRAVQKRTGVPANYCVRSAIKECLHLDIKMETGTGKTYVYTQTMYELHKRYGINKFIVVVPSLPIKAGAAQFMGDEYVTRHFRDMCGYNTEIDLLTLDTPKKKKKGRSFFPSAVSEFVKGSCQDVRKIYVLLVNMQLMKVANNYMLSRDDYDAVVEGFYRPFNALKATRPFLIIDEPHRFARDNKAFSVIMSEIAPQCIIRFGATYPDMSIGRGRDKQTVKDYQNLLYDLNACRSFNQGLIKGVAKEHLEAFSGKDEKVKITSAEKNNVVHLLHKRADGQTPYALHVGESLSIISSAFEGITIDQIDKNSVSFSNGITKQTGEELDVDIYMSSYQEQMIKLALERHFETERANFSGRKFKIKTLALFFIDDIASYRVSDDGKKPYLLETFERLLKEKMEMLIAELDTHEAEYKEYLEASLADIAGCHAGYFAQDNSSSDEAIAQEVDEILNGKKKLLAFKNEDGTPAVRRFLFSKWTLKEGWDNPNVFTIAKLRSSGSENSKLQEVGRGLRLPVDECGNRISNEEFKLNYIVDFTEADFATKLVNQINSEIPEALKITEQRLNEVAAKLNMSSDDLFEELCFEKRYIDRHYDIKPETRDKFFDEYPDFSAGVNGNKVRDRNKERPKNVKIRKAQFDEIKALWEAVNQRYTLTYEKLLNDQMEEVIFSILSDGEVFTQGVITSRRDVVSSDGSRMQSRQTSGVSYTVTKKIPYGMFLKRLTEATSVPVKTIHAAMCKYSEAHGAVSPELINEHTASAIISRFHDWKLKNLQGRFSYKKSAATIGETALSYNDGKAKEEIAQGRVGTKIVEGQPLPKYLYDTIAFDSPLEKQNIMSDIHEVIVYGKIPRSSVAIPTIAGGTYSPDFMYVVKRADGTKELNIVVETKDVENKSNLRDEEKAKISCAEVFFNTLSEQGYAVRFEPQLRNKAMAQIVNDVLNS